MSRRVCTLVHLTGADASETVCRLMIGQPSLPSWTIHTLTLLETNLDDMASEALAFAIPTLLVAGTVMKKGRPARSLSCLCHEPADKLLEVMLGTSCLASHLYSESICWQQIRSMWWM